jgi:hypothetical protein
MQLNFKSISILKLICLQVFACCFTQAQITLDSANAVGPGETIYRGTRYNDMPTAVVAGSAGPAQVWNFSDLYPEFTDSLTFINAGSTAYTNYHPSANLAVGDTNYYSYFLNDSSGFYSMGGAGDAYSTGQTCGSTYTPPYRMMQWPSTYGQQFADSFQYVFPACFTNSTPNDSIRYKVDYHSTSSADAWGTMQLSSGTYNVIRYKKILSFTDTIWQHNSTGWNAFVIASGSSESYEWWTDDPLARFQLVNLSMDTVNNIASYVTWLEINGTTTSVKPKERKNNFTMYPNPADELLTIESAGSKNGSIEIKDLSGRLVLKKILEQDKTKVEVRTLPPGIYFAHIFSGAINSQPEVLKLVIER